MLWQSALILILTVIVILLIIKIVILYRTAAEIGREFAERLRTDTNTLIAVSSRDKRMRKLADEINRELRILRKERWRFHQGDLEMKETITSVSHDLRTPLTAVCGYLELLEGEEKSENADRYLRVIAGRVNAMKQLTEELFRYTTAGAAEGELTDEEVDLRRALEESLAAYYAALKGCRITPDISMTERKLVRRLNKNALSRIFGNVLDNVIKYSDGDLKVELKDNGEILFSNKAAGLDSVRVSQLFHRFYTVERAEHATGLGLSIARHLVDQMGGKINAVYKEENLQVRICFPETAEKNR